MLNRLRITIILSLLIASVSLGQITVNTSDLPIDPGTTIHRAGNTYNPVTVDPGASGPNQSWNFTSMSAPDSWDENWVTPASTPYAASYPNANHATWYSGTPDFYQYYETTASNHQYLGSAAGGTAVNITILELPNSFPMTYNDEWWGVTELDFGIPGNSQVDTTWGVVDAWGTVTDAMGSYSCLRLQMHIMSWTVVSGIPLSSLETWQYIYLTQNGEGQVFLISNIDETNPNFTTGYFHRTTGMTGIQELPGQINLPVEISLAPAYPNPFNPNTNFDFDLPKAGNVSLVIYDAQGSMIANLQDGWMMPGSYRAAFDAASLSSGNYFARLTVGNVQQTQKITLVK
ncbi:hypothetical protein CEE37_10475 [candidate division LCP-89 bacterium B3_LCP]|uniref:Secretion system C-terminal sorting domain-containing protein n=1 Tax=candidate division LCP-89 bacterium B3_LCP TaxID=2012998 RepID=A0A532UXM5_UNCL8|nr:MAG: hypothetical protein CEE37_10475 [candidate division LCP-89 bacterium B3_LCP]